MSHPHRDFIALREQHESPRASFHRFKFSVCNNDVNSCDRASQTSGGTLIINRLFLCFVFLILFEGGREERSSFWLSWKKKKWNALLNWNFICNGKQSVGGGNGASSFRIHLILRVGFLIQLPEFITFFAYKIWRKKKKNCTGRTDEEIILRKCFQRFSTVHAYCSRSAIDSDGLMSQTDGRPLVITRRVYETPWTEK